MEAKMRGLLVALALLGTPAAAWATLPTERMDRTVGHVKRLERHNKFHLRQRMGGAFKLGGTYCGEPNGDTSSGPARCRWDATAVRTTDGSLEFGKRMRCTIEIRLRENAKHRVSWKRHVVACAVQDWGKP